MTRVSLLSVLLLAACFGEGKVEVPPLATPTSTPTPLVPTVPTGLALPHGSTLLTAIPTQDWPAICTEVAQAQDAIDLTCPGFNLQLPARDEAADAVACLSYFQVAVEWHPCDATFSDFEVMTNFIPTCTVFPTEVTRILECVNPPPTPPPTPPTPPPVCESVFDWSPGDGALNVNPITDLEWAFSAQDTTATVEVEDQDGVLVSGVASWSGSLLSFTPDADLDFNTTYTSQVTFCDAFESFFSTFTTSAVGPVVPVDSLPGRTYGIDLSDPNIVFVQPAGIGPVLQSQFTGAGLMLQIEAATPTEIELIGALANSVGFVQNLCTPTLDLPVSDFSTNPYFEAATATLPLTLGDTTIDLVDVVFHGAVPPVGDALFMSMQANIDTRPMVELLAPGGPDDVVCVLVQDFGVLCELCADGGNFCLPLQLENISALELIDNPIVLRTEDDVENDETCDPAPIP